MRLSPGGRQRWNLVEDLLDAEPSDFCIGAGGYPEKHFEAPNLKSDIRYVKEKVEAEPSISLHKCFLTMQFIFNF